ncbi:hypothetical protein BU16DRAFT_563952 [Lophium mytilinum]|uniref:Uncharacterized protein n=1 Tax=Lophium mytilinum TaxID=390894 RepID=A0A6A6QLP4_9PEZI|nr:hypothetical protein BU16DRAFT_563952 [Lophium mytilinum]
MTSGTEVSKNNHIAHYMLKLPELWADIEVTDDMITFFARILACDLDPKTECDQTQSNDKKRAFDIGFDIIWWSTKGIDNKIVDIRRWKLRARLLRRLYQHLLSTDFAVGLYELVKYFLGDRERAGRVYPNGGIAEHVPWFRDIVWVCELYVLAVDHDEERRLWFQEIRQAIRSSFNMMERYRKMDTEVLRWLRYLVDEVGVRMGRERAGEEILGELVQQLPDLQGKLKHSDEQVLAIAALVMNLKNALAGGADIAEVSAAM